MTGALVASTVHVSMSSAMPAASLAMMLAVAGAMTTTLARSASAMCSISKLIRRLEHVGHRRPVGDAGETEGRDELRGALGS